MMWCAGLLQGRLLDKAGIHQKGLQFYVRKCMLMLYFNGIMQITVCTYVCIPVLGHLYVICMYVRTCNYMPRTGEQSE